MGGALVIAGADLGGARLREIRLEGDGAETRIAAIGDRVDRAGATVLDASGGAVLPAFTDHHLHLHAMAVADQSVRCGPPQVTELPRLRNAVRGAGSDAAGWVRGIGYAESVAGDLDRHALDRIDDRRPVRIQHRSGALWFLNSRALEVLGAATADHPGLERDSSGVPTGRLWRADAWLRDRLPTPGLPDLGAVGDRLRGLGIVEVTDASPDLGDAAIANIVSAVDEGLITSRVRLLGVPLGRRIDHPRVTVGPYKIVIGDSSLPDLDELIEQIGAARAAHRAVAVHCVSTVAFALLLAAWAVTGVRPGDRIEHAGMVPRGAIPDLAALGVEVVTQPGFLPDRGDDFLEGTEPNEQVDLYRCGSLVRAGVPVALSSDAPYGPLDPWVAVGAAAERRTATGRKVGDPDEALSAVEALRRHRTPSSDPGGAPRFIGVGQRADLVIADRPLREIEAGPGDVRTVATVIAGRVTGTRRPPR